MPNNIIYLLHNSPSSSLGHKVRNSLKIFKLIFILIFKFILRNIAGPIKNAFQMFPHHGGFPPRWLMPQFKPGWMRRNILAIFVLHSNSFFPKLMIRNSEIEWPRWLANLTEFMDFCVQFVQICWHWRIFQIFKELKSIN